MITNYQEAKEQGRQALRQGLLDAASRILVTEGLEALTMRRVAQEVQCSTKVLYTMFGSKEGLFSQLYLEGFERLQAALTAVTPNQADPLDYLKRLGWAYRDFALNNPTYFGVLFSQAVPGFTPSLEDVQAAWDSFGLIVTASQECAAAGVLITDDVEYTAKAFWAGIHGAVSLELGGYFNDAEPRQRPFEMTLEAVIRGFMPNR